MKVKFLLAFQLLVVSDSAISQVRPQTIGADPRIQGVEYSPDQVVLIEVAPGYQTTIELSADEQIENVAIGDAAAWQVNANRRGDRLFIKALQPGSSTNMTVITDQRVYAMELATTYGASATPYLVRFRYPPQKSVGEAVFDYVLPGRYQLRGDKWVRPARIGDDGHRTYIDWPAERALPAVYTRDASGAEVLLNGNMRNGVFVIDSVVSMLIFRIDSRRAIATRIARRGSPQ